MSRFDILVYQWKLESEAISVIKYELRSSLMYIFRALLNEAKAQSMRFLWRPETIWGFFHTIHSFSPFFPKIVWLYIHEIFACRYTMSFHEDWRLDSSWIWTRKFPLTSNFHYWKVTISAQISCSTNIRSIYIARPPLDVLDKPICLFTLLWFVHT